MTGISYEELFEIFNPFGDLEDVQLLPNRSYSFIHFADVASSNVAYEKIHGKFVLPQDTKQPHAEQVMNHVCARKQGDRMGKS
jgi:hypothetical protein